MERWKAITGYPGYEVSDHGNVRSWRTPNKRSPRPLEPRQLRRTDRFGYQHVKLCNGPEQKQRAVHVLVLEAFVGPRPDGCVARHVNDNDRSNCCLVNLAWGTRFENESDKLRHGTRNRGSAVNTSKLSASQAIEVFSMRLPAAVIGALYGISDVAVRKIKLGHSWRHVTTPERAM